MNFNIEENPPEPDILEQERNVFNAGIKRLTTRDTLLTFVIIVCSSIVLGLIMYWYTDNIKFAGISVAIFPVLGTILSFMGVTKSIGFRSSANQIDELHNELIGVSEVSDKNKEDVNTLSTRHMLVYEYYEKIKQQGREAVNAELAMFWEFDSSTMANTARGRVLLDKAKDSVAL